jgi:hypothetical protein
VLPISFDPRQTPLLPLVIPSRAAIQTSQKALPAWRRSQSLSSGTLIERPPIYGNYRFDSTNGLKILHVLAIAHRAEFSMIFGVWAVC